MRPEVYISWRYLFTKRKEKFISLISVISVMGVAIGVMALIVVIAVMTGFDKDLRDKIVGNYAHITVASFSGIDRRQSEEIARKISNTAHVIAVSPYIQGQALLKQGKRFFAVNLKGIDPATEARATKLKEYLKAGSLSGLKVNTVIVGKELALHFDLALDSKVEVYSPSGKKYDLTVSGIFQSGMYEYDLNLVFMDMGTSQEILGLGDQVSAVEVKLDNLYAAERVRKELYKRLGYDYILKTWTETNQNFFAALQLEKLTMFIILTLIILVASFNIISTLIVLVVEKTKDIGILKAIGMNAKSVRRIFVFHGLSIGTLGIALGSAGGLALCALLKKYQFIKLPQDIYYIDKLPVSIELWPDIVLIVLAALLITLVSTVYPAKKAAQLKPVEALRYE